ELRYEYGLGRAVAGPWAKRLGPLATPIDSAIALDLQWAAEHNFVERVRFLLAHGVSAEAQSGHPGMQGRSPYELAVRAGNTEIAELLRAAGAQPTALDGPAELAAACLRADRAAATALAAADPTIVSVAEQPHGPLQRAAELG